MASTEWNSETWSLDALPCGCVITDPSQQILQANEHIEYQFGLDHRSLYGASLAGIFTKASRLFFESYAVPILKYEGFLEELQINVRLGTGQPVPVVLNAKFSPDASRIYWVIFPALQRDQLIDELHEANRALEQRTTSLRNEAITDPLTGIGNRAELDSQMESLVISSQNNRVPCALMLVDIDHFKEVNDRFGHGAGDHVLQRVAMALTGHRRNTDIAFRYGGDEFIVLLNNTSGQEASKVADRLHQRIDNLDLEVGPISVSIGIATTDGYGIVEFPALRELADQALYRAKSAGRHQTAALPSQSG